MRKKIAGFIWPRIAQNRERKQMGEAYIKKWRNRKWANRQINR